MQVSSTGAILSITKVAATSLVVASTGFAATYAWRVGASVSTSLALITCLFAVALDLVKPLSIGASFNAFSSWQIGRGLALASLGVVAVAYSLTAELSLISMSRGDLAAGRAATARQSTIQADRVQKAKEELQGIDAKTRSIAELSTLIEGAQKLCDDCNKLIKLKAEKGRSERRAELEKIINEAATITTVPAVDANSDPGAANLSLFLSALGINVGADVVSHWLSLVPVLAIELASSLSVVLVGAIGSTTTQSTNQLATPTPVASQPATQQLSSDQPKPTQELPKVSGLERFLAASQLAMQHLNSESLQSNRSPAATSNNVIPVSAYINRSNRAHSRQSAEQAILDQLKIHDSSDKFGAQRTLAAHCGINQATFNRAAIELARRGAIKINRDGNRVVMELMAG